VERIAVAPANLADYARGAAGRATFAFYMSASRTLTGAGSPARLAGEEVSPEYLDVLGVPPALGRPFQPEEFTQGAGAVVIVNHALWRDHLGGSADAAGRAIVLDGVSHQVVGVMPPGFKSITSLASADTVSFLVPAILPPDVAAGRGEHIVRVVGRLAPGVSPDEIRQPLSAVAHGIAAADPRSSGLGVVIDGLALDEAREVRPMLLVLLAGVALVLLAACAIVASLLVVRSVSRRREVAVRVALGASRGRVLLELVVQSLVLAALGAVAGLVLATWMLDVLVATAPASIPRLDAVAIDARAIVAAITLAVATAILFGILPAWQVSRSRPQDALQSVSRQVAGGWAGRSRSLLLFVEVVLSVLLMVGAGLMARSLQHLNAVDLGFDASNVLAANVTLPTAQYPTGEARFAFFERVAERVRRIPGVETVTFGNRLPLRGNWTSGLLVEGAAPIPADAPGPTAGFQAVDPGYFDTFRIPLVSGRALEPGDREGAPAVAVVSESFGRVVLGGANPLGRRVQRFEGAPMIEIVGVARDLRRGGRAADIEPQVYLAAAQTAVYPLRLSDLAVRVAGDSEAVAPLVREAIWSVDPNQPVTNVRTMDETLAIGAAERRFQSLLFTLFAALAVALAVVGIYSVVAYSVSQRTPEIGLRMALGSSAPGIVRWIVAGASLPLVAGVVAGLGAARGLSRYLESLLFGVAPTDPATYAGAAALFVLVGLAASLTAARRAAGIDPASVLR
jgi:predicted permease